MSEIAHIASHRGISQGELARRYSETSGKKIDSRNVKMHFASKRLSEKVVQTYAEMLDVASVYVGILRDSRYLKPYVYGLQLYLDMHLTPTLIEPLFEPDSVDELLQILSKNEALAIKCVNAAVLAWSRQRTFHLQSRGGFNFSIRKERLDPQGFDLWDGTGISEECRLKWAVVAEMVHSETGFDLYEKLADKSAQRFTDENLLCMMFQPMKNLVEPVEPFEWHAIQAVLESVFARRGLPIDEMRAHLTSDGTYLTWLREHDHAAGYEELPEGWFNDITERPLPHERGPLTYTVARQVVKGRARKRQT